MCACVTLYYTVSATASYSRQSEVSDASGQRCHAARFIEYIAVPRGAARGAAGARWRSRGRKVPRRPARGRPVVSGLTSPGLCARGRPSLPGRGDSLLSLFLNVFCPLARRHNCHALSSRAAALQVQGARSAAAAASVCTGGNAAIARSALCGVCKVRECVYQSAEGRRAPGAELTRPPACP